MARKEPVDHSKPGFGEVERRAVELDQARKRIADLEHRVTALQRVAKTAVTLLQPYAADRKQR